VNKVELSSKMGLRMAVACNNPVGTQYLELMQRT
jgi:hypothetical protein